MDAVLKSDLTLSQIKKEREGMKKIYFKDQLPEPEIKRRLDLLKVIPHLCHEPASLYLLHTQAVLFKAMINENIFTKNKSDNGLQKYFQNHIKIIPIEQTHQNMMLAADEIWEFILKDLL